MPLTDDSVLQENTGTVTTATGTTAPVTVTLPSGTAAGSVVLVVFSGTLQGVLTGLPTGWQNTYGVNPTGGAIYVVHGVVAAGETSWTFTTNANIPVVWWAAEVDGLDPDFPLDVTGTNNAWQSVTLPATQTLSVTTSTAAAATDTLILTAWAAQATAGKTVGTWGTYSHDLAEGGQVGTADPAQVTYRLAVAHRRSGGIDAGPFTESAVYTQADTTSTLNKILGAVLTLRAADSPIGFPVSWMTGFEQGSHFGIGSAPAIGKGFFSAVTGTVGTDIIVQASSARSPSAYGCRIVQSASAKSLAADVTQIGSGSKVAVLGFSVQVVSSTGLVVLAGVESNSTSLLEFPQVVYDTATSKIGVRLGTTSTPGTPAYQSGTTAAGTWVWVDLRLKATAATTHVDWSLAGVAQTSPADAVGNGAYTVQALRFGSTTTQTVTQEIDDPCYSVQHLAYPLGRHSIRALTVDPAGTPTVNGTVGNFALVTNNATGAALTTGTLTSARNNIDERPPTISASSDGVVQTTTAATDYLQFPMADLALSSTEVVAAVKVLACLISTTGAGAGSLSVKGWDGATEYGAITSTGGVMTPGSSTTQSATVPPYSTGMWPNTWTPTKLAAAALRVGYSDDATPDMGVHAVYLEVATRAAITARQLSVEDDTFTVDVIFSPYSSASVSYDVASGHATRGATFSYSLAGTPQTPVYVAASSSTTVTVNADAFGDVSDVTLEPDPA